MSNNEGDRRTEHQRQWWSALDLTVHSLAFHVVREHKDGRGMPRPAVLYLETARMIALEGLGFEEAKRLAVERVGTGNERVVRWAEEFPDAWANRVARDHFEGSDADTLAEVWGEHKGRFPRTLAEVDKLVRELREIIARSPDDPKRQELLEFVPGSSAKEVRETLSRRRGR